MATRGVLQRDNARKTKRKQPVSPVSNQRTMDDKFKKQNDKDPDSGAGNGGAGPSGIGA